MLANLSFMEHHSLIDIGKRVGTLNVAKQGMGPETLLVVSLASDCVWYSYIPVVSVLLAFKGSS